MNILSKFQPLPFVIYDIMKIRRKRINELMSNKADCRTAPATPGLLKLDQETWLCRTQLDDFLVKIGTILDQTRTRFNLVVKAILWNLW